MPEISRVALFGKLNQLGYKAIESATVFCKLRGNPYVELVHWIHQILQLQDSDLHRIIKQFNLEPSRLVKDLTDALDRLPRGSTSISDLSAHVEEAVERGWVYGSLMFKESQIRTGYLIIGILKTQGLRNTLPAISKEFEKLKSKRLLSVLMKSSVARQKMRWERKTAAKLVVVRYLVKQVMQLLQQRWASRKRLNVLLLI